MQFLSFTRLGRAGFGARVENGIVDLTERLAPSVTSLRQAIIADLLPAASAYVLGRRPEFTEADVALLPVIPDPGKILCVGLNYETHRAETKRPDAKYPTIFTRFADTQIAHRQTILKPRVSDHLDYEAELAVVIGRGGRYIAEENALEHVAGYACYNDATIRDWQRHTFQFTPGKNFPSTGAFGPQLVTPDEVGDYRNLSIKGKLNGEVMQDAKLSDLIFPIATLISYCSSFTPLQPGDVILTGTPGGVGDRREPPIFMKPGDVFEVEIPGIGSLINTIAAES
ncbi:fumarylacetoacetate hydrolase family protein [Agrobacterium rhizogenes]|uniref:fumarylacetoacetate hydrolase family protein n=1 Tax=Rhizobium rhizogenes TaxID=359 RepID=UPI000DDDA4EE|nr:fumarylacetoacetate hydrolase family protein [Rhizobium rhizogenes]KAA6487813.1 FAA hydrolase family protein [Agrobacterium sp. ICMP 7243]NTF89516.1 fumarylacetoacetate hydrolase family protein [Rhizobium rhizogenes]NTG16764.1 fumarylacetoacetate hydrolase family protein [Rhizobium rhizogenes]NTG23466.1 fumarylacetoacetate hydrolase family protein [Rhizobium rhizogenes]NTG30375.1 fumarylacetoacetate hydrolase family protein [Rhizobium rhizogenes]